MAVAYKQMYLDEQAKVEAVEARNKALAEELEAMREKLGKASVAQPTKLEFPIPLHVQTSDAKHFIIIGASGNGGYLIPNLVRQVALQNKILKAQGHRGHSITIIDADEVEEKNLNRQNFVRNDVQKNKAQVMADRYGRAFGMDINYVDEYIENVEHLTKVVDSQRGIPFVIGCVDNNKSRKIVHDWIQNHRGAWWLDSGRQQIVA